MGHEQENSYSHPRNMKLYMDSYAELYHITSEVDTTSMTYLHKSFKIHTPNQQRPGSYKTSYITIQPTITLTT
jgi:hypothetical protein